MLPSAENDYAYRLDKMCGNMNKKCVKWIFNKDVLGFPPRYWCGC